MSDDLMEQLRVRRTQAIQSFEHADANLFDGLEARIKELEAECDARVSVELLNIERETCDRIRAERDKLAEQLNHIRQQGWNREV